MKIAEPTMVMIPARGGSKRVPAKNLRMLAGKPMIAYAIECALEAKRQGAALGDIVVNTDSDDIEAAATHFGAEVYRRPAELGSDEARGDDFAADFIDKRGPGTLVMLNPACPLLEPSDVVRALDAYEASSCDTLISCEQTQMQAFCRGRAINIDVDEPLEPTQSNPPVQVLNFAVTIWDAPTFAATYAKTRSGYLGVNRLLFAISRLRAIKVSNPDDFALVERLLHARSDDSVAEPRYWNKSS